MSLKLRGTWRVNFLAGMLHFVALASAQAQFSIVRAQSPEARGDTVEVTAGVDSNDMRMLEPRVIAAVDKVLPAIVAVGNRFGRAPEQVIWEGRRFASGVIIREDGLILSQYHVSHTGVYNDSTGLREYGKPGDKVDVILHDGRHMEAELLGGERLADVALLRLTEPGTYPFATFSEDSSSTLGDWVVKLGHPVGYQATRGSVARIGRVVYTNPVNIVADCPTVGGDSGGPLVNLDGQIVGLIQDSSMPPLVAAAASERGFPMSYMTMRKIRQKMGSMLAGAVPHETTFENHFERERMYEDIEELLPAIHRRKGAAVLATWQAVATQAKGSVIEILDADRNRAAYGTVVDTDGWIVTKASATHEYPFCRLPDGNIVAARTIGKDSALDLALLKVNATGLRSVQWSPSKALRRGTFVMTMGLDSSPIATGIVSATVHSDPVCIEDHHIVTGSYPEVFDHDMTLETNEFGGPVLDLNGHAIGITIAAPGLHGCLSLPSEHILNCIQRLK